MLHSFRALSGLPLEDHGVVVLQGGSTPHLYNSDNEPLFRWAALPRLAAATLAFRQPQRRRRPAQFGPFGGRLQMSEAAGQPIPTLAVT